MSMNLTYEFYGDNGEFIDMADFEFQTPTDLTFAVLKMNTKDEQVDAIAKFLKDHDWSEENLNDAVSEMKRKLSHKSVKLGMI